MKRPLLAVAAALLIAASMAGAALAAQPHHFKGTFSDSFVVPAGERCDFDERISFTLVFNDIVFGDVDGVVVVPQDLAGEVISRALDKVSGENTVRSDLEAGASVAETFRKYGIL